MSIKRSLQRQFERKSRKQDIKQLYAHADAIQNRVDLRYREKEEERTLFSFSCVLAMCCRVLCREFGWGKLPKDQEASDYYRLVRFARAVEDEVNSFTGYTGNDIKKYLDMVYRECGVKFEYK